jgi:7,8-dihydroneopterin aldolase/epimerase/oxygenase
VTHVVEVRGLRVDAVCGVLDEERRAPQPLRVDLDVELDVEVAASSDALADTVNYADLVDRAVTTLVSAQPFLLESACDKVGAVVLDADHRVTAVTVTIAKLRPPIPHDVETVGVRRRLTR